MKGKNAAIGIFAGSQVVPVKVPIQATFGHSRIEDTGPFTVSEVRHDGSITLTEGHAHIVSGTYDPNDFIVCSKQ